MNPYRRIDVRLLILFLFLFEWKRMERECIESGDKIALPIVNLGNENISNKR